MLCFSSFFNAREDVKEKLVEDAIKKNVSLEVVDDAALFHVLKKLRGHNIVYRNDLYATIKYFNLNLSHL